MSKVDRLEEKKKKYLSIMGVEVWRLKGSEFDKNDAKMKKQIIKPKCDQNIAQSSWEELSLTVNSCQLCELCKSRSQVVFGVGNKNADLMLIGEAPGANEDLKGEPFVGRAGMLLNSMLRSINLRREDVYIANILKCRPPNNRDPSSLEVKLCTPYLLEQINLIKPKLIVAVGRIAAQFLLNTDESMGNLRNNKYYYGQHKTPLLVIYHPAYLLRSPQEKKKAYSDMLLIQNAISSIQ